MKRILLSVMLLTAASLLPLAAEESLIHLNDSNFAKVTGNDIFIVDFYADWCGPCRAFAPTYEEAAEELTEYNFAKVNVDNCPKLSTQFSIEYIPYIVAVKNGTVLEEYAGSRTKADFINWVKKVNQKYK